MKISLWVRVLATDKGMDEHLIFFFGLIGSIPLQLLRVGEILLQFLILEI
jgi:hypothetical protein